MTEPFAVDLLDIDKIDPNPRNPNQGDIGAIAVAIAVDGWHGAVLCQYRARKNPMIFAGEHRWHALRLLQHDGIDLPGRGHLAYADLAADPTLLLPPLGKVPAQVLKVDDVRALRKMLADNRASALATPDEERLLGLLRGLAEADDLGGTLFDGDDVDAMMEAAERALHFPPPGALPAPPPDVAGIRSVILPMAEADYVAFTASMGHLRNAWGLDSNADVVVRAVADACERLGV